jgi:Sensors of blue-light using FAD
VSLFRLVYFSRSRLPASVPERIEAVSTILAASIARNRAADISGGMVFDSNWFVQVLEGDRENVSATIERIYRDHRHCGVVIAEARPIAHRDFAFWWMAAAPWREETASIFAQYCGSPYLVPSALPGGTLVDLVGKVMHYEASHMRTSPHQRWLSGWRTGNERPTWTIASVTNAA